LAQETDRVANTMADANVRVRLHEVALVLRVRALGLPSAAEEVCSAA
jgi:hypothetical protein